MNASSLTHEHFQTLVWLRKEAQVSFAIGLVDLAIITCAMFIHYLLKPVVIVSMKSYNYLLYRVDNDLCPSP